MDQDLVRFEVEVDGITRDAKIIMWLSVISVIATPLYLISLLYFMFYSSKLSKLKNDQSLSGIFNTLKGKTRKELKSIRGSSESLEHRIAGLLLTHRTMLSVLIITGIIIAIIIGVISMGYQMGWQVT